MLNVGSECSGIRGIELGLESTGGFKVIWHAEINEDCAEFIKGIPNHGNIKTADWSKAEPIDVLTAGYPCQPFSHAGKRQGKDDPRHLWPDVLRSIQSLRPLWVVLENVAGHVSLGLREVLADLRGADYTPLGPLLVEAACFGATHHRERVIILAHRNSDGRARGIIEETKKGRNSDSIAVAEPESVLANSNDRRCARSSERECCEQGVFEQQWGTQCIDQRGCTGVLADTSGQRQPEEGQYSERSTQWSSSGGQVLADPEFTGQSRSGEPLESVYSTQDREGQASDALYDGRWPAQPRMGGGPDGFPYRLYQNSWPLPPGETQWEWEPERIAKKEANTEARLTALGNAVVPHVGAFIGWLILKLEKEMSE